MTATPSILARARRQARLPVGRLLPLAGLALAIIAVLAFDLDRHLTFEALRENRVWLTDVVAANGSPRAPTS